MSFRLIRIHFHVWNADADDSNLLLKLKFNVLYAYAAVFCVCALVFYFNYQRVDAVMKHEVKLHSSFRLAAVQRGTTFHLSGTKANYVNVYLVSWYTICI